MSSQGWHLQSLGRYFANFTQDESRDYKYSFIAIPSKERDRFIAEKGLAGWEYVDSKKDNHVFRVLATNEVSDSNLYTQQRQRTLKILRKNLFWQVMSALFGLALFILQGFIGNNRMLFFTTDLTLIAVTIFLLVLGSGTRGLIYLSMAQKRLGWGETLPSNQAYPETILRGRIIKISIILTMFLVFGPNAITAVSSAASQEVPRHIPVFQITDLYADEFTYESKYNTYNSLLVPECWELNQSRGEFFNSEYHSMLSIHGYRARTPWLARVVAEESTRMFRFGSNPGLHFDIANRRDVDEIWVNNFDYERSHEFVILKDTYVIHVFYLGKARPAEELIQLAIESLSHWRQ